MSMISMSLGEGSSRSRRRPDSMRCHARWDAELASLDGFVMRNARVDLSYPRLDGPSFGGMRVLTGSCFRSFVVSRRICHRISRLGGDKLLPRGQPNAGGLFLKRLANSSLHWSAHHDRDASLTNRNRSMLPQGGKTLRETLLPAKG
jgi:hypothetical protein